MAPDRFEALIDDLAETFAVVARAMLSTCLAFLRGRATFDEANRVIDGIGDDLKAEGAQWAEEIVPQIYADSSREALEAPQTPDLAPEGLSGNEHDQTIDLFIAEVAEGLQAATDSIARDAKDTLREIARKNIAASVYEGVNPREEVSKMEREIQKKGVVFKDRRGREWDTRAYSKMVLRTLATKVANQAHLNTAGDLGSPGVEVRDGGPGDVDEPCLQANGKKWSLNHAKDNLLEHPNCRRAFAPLPTDFRGELDKT